MVLERNVRLLFDSLARIEVLLPECEILNSLIHLMNHCEICRSSHCVPVQVGC